MLLEGSSVRSTERITGVHRDTILSVLVEAGEACERFLSRLVQNVKVDDVEADEIWSFVGCKEKTRLAKGYGEEKGDAWCYVGLERTSKLILAWHMGKRSTQDTLDFTAKLRRATADDRFQISTDGYAPYRLAVPAWFGQGADFAQLAKTYGSPPERGPEARYSPGEVIGVVITIRTGDPDPDRICTSHVERSNLSIRTSLRRLTRLVIGHSKKWENHRAALALYFAHYNLCRDHTTLRERTGAKCTPAMAAGLTDHVWSVGELLANAA
jgi:IS1 family transposase